MKSLHSTIRTVLCTTLVGGVLTVAALAALPALPANAAAPTCNDTWNVTAAGTYSWGTSGDWSNGLPVATSIVCITKPGKYTVQLIGGTTTIDALEVGSGNAGDSEILDLFGTCSNNAILDTNNTAVSPDNDDINSTGSVILGSSSCGNNATLGIGTVLNESSGGILETDADAGGSRSISGNVTSDGTTNIDTSASYTSGTWDNAGPLGIADGQTLTVSTATPAATFTDDTGGSVSSSGTSKTGQLVVGSGNTYNQGNGTTSGEPVLLDNGGTAPGVALHYTGTGASTVETLGVGTLDGNIASAQTLEIAGYCSDNAVESEDASLTSQGTIELTSVSCGNPSTLAIGSGFTLTNDGTLETLGGAGNDRYISGNVTNGGTVNISDISQYTSGTWDNAGALDLATGETLTAATATPIVTFTDDTGGSIVSTGTGQLIVGSGNTYNQGNGTTSGGEPVLLDNGGTAPGVTLHYTGTGSSTVETLGVGTVDGNIASAQTLEIAGYCSDNAVESEDASLTSQGTIELTSVNCGNPSTLAIGSGFTLTNDGTLETLSGAGSTRYISGNVTNGGTVNISDASQYTSGKWDNAGALDLATGDTMTIATATPAATFTDDTGGSVVSTGTGQLIVDEGNTFNQGNGTATGGEPVLLSNGGSGTIALNYTGTGAPLYNSTIWTYGLGTVTGTIQSGETLDVTGYCSDDATETTGGNLKDYGTINLTSATCGNSSTLAMPKPDTLTVEKTTGQLNTEAGAGADRFISGNVKNKGAVNIGQVTTYTPIKKGLFTNQGTVTVASGESLSVASVKKAVFLNTKKGVITGTGQMTVNGLSTFEDAGTATITGTPVLVNAAKLEITGTGAGAIDVEGTSTFAGNIALGQTVNVLGYCSDNATLTGSASASNAGTLNISNTSCSNNSEFALGVGDTLTNTPTGVIETLTGAGGAARTIDANITNNGTIGPSGDNTLTIDGNLTDTSTAIFDANVNTNASDLIAMGAGDTATLAGTLTAVPVAGFTPTNGYSATIITGTHAGTFSTVGPAGWSAAYGTSVTLNFT